MKEYFIYVPYLATFITGIGFLMIITSKYNRLSRKQIERLRRLYDNFDVPKKDIRASPEARYQKWLKTILVQIGYSDRIDLFYSMTRATVVFFTLISFGFVYLSGCTLKTSIITAIIIGVSSLSIPHLILMYFLKQRQNVITQELSSVANYIYEAINGAEKDLYNALDEAQRLTNYLSDPLARYLNRYRTIGPQRASEAFLLEVPIPEAEQFITLISNGFEYRDKHNLMGYIQALNTTRHSLTLSAKKRKEKQREQLYSALVIIPAGLAIAITLFVTYAKVINVLESTTW